MDFRPQPQFARGLENTGRLFDREKTFVAEDVDEIGQPFGRHGGQPFVAHQIDILPLPSPVGTRHGMRPEERGPHLQRHAFADAADDAQHLQLVPGRKAVAALDLHAPRTHRRDLAHALHRLRIEFVLRSLVQPVGGVENAPAPPGDLLVRQTVDLVQKLPLAAPGVDQVGVRVAERRKEHASCRVDDLVGGDVAQRVHASERRETAVFSQQPRVVERAQLVHVGAAAAQTARRFDADDAGDVLHQQSHRPRRNRTEASIWGYITSSLSMKGTSLR